ncbi:MAG TPA: DUF2520 domain-containing protein [Actinomycetota bacterium]|nr:DUF2520 domain-containing protein [Actinomycetota bacterium]
MTEGPDTGGGWREPADAPSLRVALIGAGAVGTAVSVLLVRGGHRISGVASRSGASARRAAGLLGARVFDPSEELPDSDVVLIATPDGAIAEVAARLAPRVGPRSVVCHFAGSLGLGPLRAVLAAGAEACALHPVQALPNVDSAVARLPGSAWGVTSTQGARPWAFSVVENEFQGHPVWVAEEHRPLWHAAAVTTSAGLRALLSTAVAALESIGVEEAPAVLAPLVVGTAANSLAEGVTLTGPFVRGETDTVVRHLAAYDAYAPDLKADYVRIAGLILDGVARDEALAPGAQSSIRAVLESA